MPVDEDEIVRKIISMSDLSAVGVYPGYEFYDDKTPQQRVEDERDWLAGSIEPYLASLGSPAERFWAEDLQGPYSCFVRYVNKLIFLLGWSREDALREGERVVREAVRKFYAQRGQQP